MEVNSTMLISGFDCETKTRHFSNEQSEVVSNCNKKFSNVITEPGSVYIYIHTHLHAMCMNAQVHRVLFLCSPFPSEIVKTEERMIIPK